MLKRCDLSGPELKQLACLESDERVQARLMMIGYMCDGLDPDAAARAVGLRRASGYKWARRYEAEGVAGLSDRPRSGRPAKLDMGKTLLGFSHHRYLFAHRIGPQGGLGYGELSLALNQALFEFAVVEGSDGISGSDNTGSSEGGVERKMHLCPTFEL